MHIPDNYLSPGTCAAMGAAMVPVWALSLRRVRAEVPRARIPLLGVGAAFSFLIMMFNVPLPGGTSGHAVGAVLVAALLGPWAACLAVSVALLLQALLFGDGGVLAFGANGFNMAFVLPFSGYLLFDVLRRRLPGPRGEAVALGAAAYVGLCLAALCAAVELGLQPLLARDAAGVPLYFPYPLSVSIPAMLAPHLLVAGWVEVAFTVAIHAFIRRVSPGAAHEGGAPARPLYLALGVLALLSPAGLLAAGTAWGEWRPAELAHVAVGGKALGYVPAGMARGWSLDALLPAYGLPGVPASVGYALCAVIGAALLVIGFKLLGLLRKDARPAA